MKLKNNKEDDPYVKSDDSKHPSSQREVLKELLYTYSDSTTLHCICHLRKRDYSWWRRAIWIILFIGLMVGFTYEFYKLCSRYFEYHTVTKTVVLFEDEIDFPAVTICNLNKIDDDSVTDPDIRRLLQETYMNPFANMTYFNSLNTSFVNSVNLTHYFVSRPRLSSGTAINCRWQMVQISCMHYFKRVMTNYGDCLAFNSKDYIKSHGKSLRLSNPGSDGGLILSLMAYQEHYFIGDSAAAGFKVVVHDPNDEPGVKEDGVVISPGTSTQLGIRKTETIYLPNPVRAFGQKFCFDTESRSLSKVLKYYEKYSLRACLAECEADYTAIECGCREVLQPGTIRVCNAYEYVTCARQSIVNFSRSNKDACKCSLPCKNIEYNMQVSSAWFPRENYIEINFRDTQYTTEYFRRNAVELRVFFEDKLYKQQIQVLELTDGDVYAALGGFMGLFFGASCGTIAEILELIFGICYNMCKRNHNLKKT